MTYQDIQELAPFLEVALNEMNKGTSPSVNRLRDKAAEKLDIKIPSLTAFSNMLQVFHKFPSILKHWKESHPVKGQSGMLFTPLDLPYLYSILPSKGFSQTANLRTILAEAKHLGISAEAYMERLLDKNIKTIGDFSKEFGQKPLAVVQAEEKVRSNKRYAAK